MLVNLFKKSNKSSFLIQLISGWCQIIFLYYLSFETKPNISQIENKDLFDICNAG